MVVPFENLYLMDYLRFDDFTRVEWLVFSSTCREKVSLFVCVFRASYVVVTERIREHPAFTVAHPHPFASCRFSFQIVPFFLTGAVVFFRRDESHMAGRKRNRSIYDLRILLVSCCFFLFESLSFAAKKTSSNFTPASIFISLSRSIMWGSSSTRNKGRMNKGAPILIALYRIYPFFFVLATGLW